MAMDIGTVAATSGMTEQIYEMLDLYLAPPLQQAVTDAPDDAKAAAQEALDAARDGWKKLAHAVATGVVEHITDNLDIAGVQATGTVTITHNGNSGGADPAAHTHTVNLSGSHTVVFNQVAGTGSVS